MPESSTPDNSDIRGLALFFALMYFVQSLGDPGSGIVAQPLRSMLIRWNESPASVALFMALVSLPWTLKPLFGLLSDFVPILGSRRRIYLIISITSTVIGFALVAGLSFVAPDYWLLLAILMLPAVGIAFSDVLIDAVMIDEGQPRGMTGVFQSIQWTAAYAGMLLTGFIGGYLADIQRPDLAFGSCALLWGLALLLTLAVVREKIPAHTYTMIDSIRSLALAARQPGLLAVAFILFIWNLNPLWSTVLYLHLTGTMGFTEITFGHTISVFSLGAMLGSFLYPAYCRRVNPGTLIHVSILAGVLSNLFYLFIVDEWSAYIVALLGGFSYMTGTMIQMDIAARRIPIIAAATIFALMMAISNLAAALSEAIGGNVYEVLIPLTNSDFAYNMVVSLSIVAPALCWLIIPEIRRQLPEWFR